MRHLLWFFVPTIAFGQTLQDIETRFKEPERFSEARHINTAVYEYPYRPISLSFIKLSNVVQRALKSDAAIQDINTYKVTTNGRRGAIVDVYERMDEKGFFYLVDSTGQVTRRVHTNFLEPFDDVSLMYEPPKHYVEINQPKEFAGEDKDMGLMSQLSLRVGQTSANWTADLLNDTRATNAFATTIGTNLLLKWSESFRIGGTFQFETATHRLASSTAQYQNPSFGLIIQSPPSTWGGGPWRVGAQFRTGPFGTLRVQDSGGRPTNIKLRTTSFQLDWQFIGNNGWGEWSLGLAVQRDYPKVRRQEGLYTLNSESVTNDQVGLFLTQGWSW